MPLIQKAPFPSERIVTVETIPSEEKLGVWEAMSDYVVIAPGDELVPAVGFRVVDCGARPGFCQYVPLTRCTIYIVEYDPWPTAPAQAPANPPTWEWVGGAAWGDRTAMTRFGGNEGEGPTAWKDRGLLTELSGVLCNTFGLFIRIPPEDPNAVAIRFKFAAVMDRAAGTTPNQTIGTFS